MPPPPDLRLPAPSPSLFLLFRSSPPSPRCAVASVLISLRLQVVLASEDKREGNTKMTNGEDMLPGCSGASSTASACDMDEHPPSSATSTSQIGIFQGNRVVEAAPTFCVLVERRGGASPAENGTAVARRHSARSNHALLWCCSPSNLTAQAGCLFFQLPCLSLPVKIVQFTIAILKQAPAQHCLHIKHTIEFTF